MGKWTINGPEQPPPKQHGKKPAPPAKAGSQSARGKEGDLVGSGPQPTGKKPPQKL